LTTAVALRSRIYVKLGKVGWIISFAVFVQDHDILEALAHHFDSPIARFNGSIAASGGGSGRIWPSDYERHAIEDSKSKPFLAASMFFGIQTERIAAEGPAGLWVTSGLAGVAMAMRRASSEGMRVILLRIELVKRFLKEAQRFISQRICSAAKNFEFKVAVALPPRL
jgi:hypothetical protein